jgi:hypothetical protein
MDSPEADQLDSTGSERVNGLLLVAGMHRSGTSALCAALHACGVDFGQRLLDPIAGVNDEGFWEDRRLVAINDALLEVMGFPWYAAPADFSPPDWSAARFGPQRRDALALLSQAPGQGAVQGMKDPRLCLTLGFWLELCEQAGISPCVCTIARAPLEVAASLERRDGLPPGAGLQLYLNYYRALVGQLPPDALWLTYDALLTDPRTALAPLEQSAGIDLAQADFDSALNTGLRHHRSDAGEEQLGTAPAGPDALAALAGSVARYIEEHPPLVDTLRALVARGGELTRIGELHSAAIATLQQRDDDVARLGSELNRAVDTVAERDGQVQELNGRLAQTGAHLEQALATIEERDGQIGELDARLHEEGRMHGEALARIEELEAGLQRLFARPGIGPLIKVLWKRDRS